MRSAQKCTLPLSGVLVSAVLSFFIHIPAYIVCPWVLTGNTKWGFGECCNDSQRKNCSFYDFDLRKGYLVAAFVLRTIAFGIAVLPGICLPLRWTGKKRYVYPLMAATPGVFLGSAVAIFGINYQSDSTLLQYGTPTLAYGFWLQVAAVSLSCTTVFAWWIYDLSRPDVPSTFPSLLAGFRKTVLRLWKTKKTVSVATRKKEKTPQSSFITLPAQSTDCPAATTLRDATDLSHLQNYDISLSTYGLVMFPQRLYQHRSSPPPPYDVAVVDVNVSPPSYRSLWSSRPSVHHDTASTVV